MSLDHGKNFIAPQANNYYAIHDYNNIFNIDYYMNLFDADIVIFEAADITLYEYFFSQYYMETMQLQPYIDRFDYEIKDLEISLNVDKESNGVYDTFIVNNPTIDYDYCYLKIDDKYYDFRKYDNENICITLQNKDTLNKNIDLYCVSTMDNKVYKIPFIF